VKGRLVHQIHLAAWNVQGLPFLTDPPKFFSSCLYKPKRVIFCAQRLVSVGHLPPGFKEGDASPTTSSLPDKNVTHEQIIRYYQGPAKND